MSRLWLNAESFEQRNRENQEVSVSRDTSLSSEVPGVKMALASGHWMDKEMRGEAPSPRHGHALAVAGNVAFLFGGVSSVSQAVDTPVYFNDFYMLTVYPDDVTWEEIPQSGEVPTAREGHTLCVVRGKLYLFGGSSCPDATECLPGVYSFDIVSLTWDCFSVGGVALRTLRHSSVAVGDNIYVYGGVLEGSPTNDLMVFNTDFKKPLCTRKKESDPLEAASFLIDQLGGLQKASWIQAAPSGMHPSWCLSPGHQLKLVDRSPQPCKTWSSSLWCDQSFALVGDQVFMFGGFDEGGEFSKDLYVLNTETLVWQKWEVKGECPAACSGQTLTAHHDKDIYLFGGKSTNQDGAMTTLNEIHKFSIAKKKWKVPLYVGIPPARRYGHTAFILHSHLFVFGGRNEEQELNDLKVMKLINPSERQPVMKEILLEFGLQGVSHSFTPTKVPNVRYELSDSPTCNHYRRAAALTPEVSIHRDFSAARDQAMKMIQSAFTLLDQEFQKLDREKSELTKAAAALERDKEAFELQKQQHQQELQEMLDRHRSQNEAWLRARAEENDRERRELCRLREEVLQEQERLKEEQSSIQKRSEHLLSIMQQFKGM